MIIRLDFPPAQLSPNARLHWAKVANFKRSYKAIWLYQMRNDRDSLKGKTEFNITFAPPDKRRRDVDNIIAACKSLVDALSVATGVDDSQFKIMWPRAFSKPLKGGAVFVEVVG